MTAEQRALPITRRTGVLGALLGVIAGCCLGLTNLLFMDTERTETLKLLAQQQHNGENEFSFQVEVSNKVRDDATVFTVRGPDVDGVMASLTTALAGAGCSVVDLMARRVEHDDTTTTDTSSLSSLPLQQQVPLIEDVFVVVRQGDKIPDMELEGIARILLEATIKPVNNAFLTVKLEDLENRNAQLQERIDKLESLLKDRNIVVTKSR